MYQDAYGNVMLDGFPYGPDTILDMMKLTWESPSLKADLSLKYLRKGSYGIESAYPPLTASPPGSTSRSR